MTQDEKDFMVGWKIAAALFNEPRQTMRYLKQAYDGDPDVRKWRNWQGNPVLNGHAAAVLAAYGE